jgi:hypothetical protein
MTLRNDDEQIELIKLIGSRMQDIKESVPTTWTKDETRFFAEGSASTLLYLAKRLLPEDAFGDVDQFIDSEMKSINRLIYRK